MSDSITIDGVGPMPVVRPTSAAELGEIVRRCAADGTAIYPVGGGTMLDYGLPPARPGVAVELRALDKVIDFPARDMTITVEAGITFAKLDQIVRAEGLHLPIDVPNPERATLGGAIACNVSGPRRYGYGTFRDYVLGITTVNDRGEQVSAGGRVVKNVAGYDLMKLHTGALGTLGIITQVTLKLRPVPEETAAVMVGVPAERLGSALELISQSKTRPQYIMCDPCIFVGGGWNWPTRIGFYGSSEAVGWQIEQLKQEFGGDGWDFCVGMVGNRGFAEPPEIPNRFLKDAICRFRASIPPSAVAQFCVLGKSLDKESCVLAFPGNGTVLIELRSVTPVARSKEITQRLVTGAIEYGGNVFVQYCPPEWKKSLPIWGRPPTDVALQKAVKRALDPHNIFNPGRFVTDAF